MNISDLKETLELSVFSAIDNLPNDIKNNITEIRLRYNKPLCVRTFKNTYYLNTNSTFDQTPSSCSFITTQDMLDNTLKKATNFCFYNRTDDIKNGFITTSAGGRIGIAGTAVIDNGEIQNIKDISSVNIRIARDIKGIADRYMPFIVKQNRALGGLILGKPMTGKTTLIRDIARQLSLLNFNVCIVDQRNEIAAMNMRQSGFDIGNCDVLSGYPKSKGLEIAIKTMSPDIIICDEITDKETAQKIIECVNCGVEVIATAHANHFDDLLLKPYFLELVKTNVFKYIVELGECND